MSASGVGKALSCFHRSAIWPRSACVSTVAAKLVRAVGSRRKRFVWTSTLPALLHPNGVHSAIRWPLSPTTPLPPDTTHLLRAQLKISRSMDSSGGGLNHAQCAGTELSAARRHGASGVFLPPGVLRRAALVWYR